MQFITNNNRIALIMQPFSPLENRWERSFHVFQISGNRWSGPGVTVGCHLKSGWFFLALNRTDTCDSFDWVFLILWEFAYTLIVALLGWIRRSESSLMFAFVWSSHSSWLWFDIFLNVVHLRVFIEQSVPQSFALLGEGFILQFAFMVKSFFCLEFFSCKVIICLVFDYAT